MNFLRNLLKVLLSILVVAVITPLASEYLLPLLRIQNIYADIYTGEWQPYPDTTETKNRASPIHLGFDVNDLDYFDDVDFNNFSTIVLENTGYDEIKGITVQLGKDMTSIAIPDVMVLSGDKPSKRTFIKKATEFKVPAIAAGKKVKIFLWHPYKVYSSFTFRSLRIFTPSHGIPLRFHQYDDYETKYDNTPWIVWFVGEWGYSLFLMLIAAIGSVVFIMALLNEAYFRQLFNDRDFYRDERARYDVDPKKFLPDFKFLNKK